MGWIDDGKGSILWGRPDPEIAHEMIPSPELIPKRAHPQSDTSF